MKVFANMWDSGGVQSTSQVSRMVCAYEDIDNSCSGNKNECTRPDSDIFHICPFGFQKPLNSEIASSTWDASCSANMRSVPMILLHEMTHVTDIGAAVRGTLGIIDLASGAYACFQLDDDGKGDNAQNYAWLAGDAYWSRKCDVSLSDAVASIKAVREDEGPMTFDSIGSPECYGTSEFEQPEAAAAIHDFCGNYSDSIIIVPLVSFGNVTLPEGRSRALGIDNGGVLVNNGANKLWMDVHFAESSCYGNFPFDQTKCKAQLGSILNGCNTAGLYPKTGGWIKPTMSCAVYCLLATGADDPTPLYVQAMDGNMGDWTCEDTDTMGIDHGHDNTCTCYYSLQSSMTDTFDKPDGGCSTIPSNTNPTDE